MKKMLMALAVLIISASVSMGALTVYDSFGDEVSTNSVPAGWVSSTPGVDEHSRIDSGSLDYPGFAASAGNSWGRLGQLAADYYRDVPDVTGLVSGDKVYYSFLMRLNTPLDAFSSGSFRLFNTAASTGSGLCVGWGTPDYTTDKMGFSLSNRNRYWSSAVGADNIKTPTNYPIADTVYLIVLGYNRGANAAGSSVELWVNPDPATFGTGTPPAATLTMPSYQNSTGYNNEAKWDRLTYLSVSTGSGSGVTNWQVDEVRVGRTWADNRCRTALRNQSDQQDGRRSSRRPCSWVECHCLCIRI